MIVEIAKAAQAFVVLYDRIYDSGWFGVAGFLINAQQISFIRIADKHGVKGFAKAIKITESVNVAFQEVRSCPHFRKYNEVVKFVVHHVLLNNIRFLRRSRGHNGLVGHGVITNCIRMHSLVFQLLNEFRKAAKVPHDRQFSQVI